VLTYLGERQKEAIEDLSKEMNVAAILPCDVTKDEELAALTESLRGLGRPLHAVMHSLAFANREDLSRPFVETSRSGFLLAQDVSAYSLVAMARATAPLMTEGGALLTLTYLGATRVMPNYNVMGVAKASLEAAMRYLASDLGPQKIRVNAISAGPVKTASMRAVKDAPAFSMWCRSVLPCAAIPIPRKWPTPPSSWRATWAAASRRTSCLSTPACR
jgi:enoyl-[acyl-carrier protein] reductase I